MQERQGISVSTKIKNRMRLWAFILAVTLGAGILGCGTGGTATAAAEAVSSEVKETAEERKNPEQSETTETELTEQTGQTGQTEQETAGFVAALDNVVSDTPPAAEPNLSWAEKKLQVMTVEQKVAQLFFVAPEALTGVSAVTRTGDVMKQSFAACPVGGILYSTPNLEGPEQTAQMTGELQRYVQELTGIPVFISIDEEGGKVTRIAKNATYGVNNVGNMKSIGDTGDVSAAEGAGSYIGAYLSANGFNMDFAPDADVLTNPANTVIGPRSFGSDAQLVSSMAAAFSRGLASQGILACYKHFPGHGGTGEDSHEGYAYTYKSLEELRQCDLIPFAEGIGSGLQVIMVSHVSCPGVNGDDTPATLSPRIVTGLLREEMGFAGVIITDALDMGAISSHYEKTEACRKALEAGCDMLLICGDFKSAYEGILAQVKNGTIPESRIDESVLRILRVKETIGLR